MSMSLETPTVIPLGLGAELQPTEHGGVVRADLPRDFRVFSGSDLLDDLGDALLLIRTNAKFASRNPRVFGYLANKGYDFTADYDNTQRSYALCARFPETQQTSDGPLQFTPYTGGSFSGTDFISNLAEGRVLISADRHIYEAHDNIIHRPAWELVNSMNPDLAVTLIRKAGRLVTNPGLKGSPDDIALAEHQINSFSGALDVIMDLGNGVVTGMNMKTSKDPDDREDALSYSIHRIGQLFRTPRALHEDYWDNQTPADPEASTKDIERWAQVFYRAAGK